MKFDIKEITGRGPQYNLHTHTQFCDGRATMQQMCEAGLASGFHTLGFSPHGPIAVESGCNMSRASVAEYVAETDRLRERYAGSGMTILCGMEIDYLGCDCGPACPRFVEMPLDFRIGSVHFVPTREGRFVDCDGSAERFRRRLDEDFGGDLEYVVATYFRQVRQMIEAGGFDIVGHIDKIARNADACRPGIDATPEFMAEVRSLLELTADRGMALEINTKAWESNGRFFPHSRYWADIRRLDIPVVINSDAHYTDRINAGRDEALQFLNDITLR